jgi:hypothetical protein
MVDRAESTLGWDDVCQFCAIMLSVPAAIACARVDDVDHATRHLEIARQSLLQYQGTSWEAGLAEAEAAIATARGDVATAHEWLRTAAEHFDRAGQPLDAARCRLAVAS